MPGPPQARAEPGGLPGGVKVNEWLACPWVTFLGRTATTPHHKGAPTAGRGREALGGAGLAAASGRPGSEGPAARTEAKRSSDGTQPEAAARLLVTTANKSRC